MQTITPFRTNSPRAKSRDPIDPDMIAVYAFTVIGLLMTNWMALVISLGQGALAPLG